MLLYEPQDKESLPKSYCELLKKLNNINKDILGGSNINDDQSDKGTGEKST
jgi:hypothetical protein